MNVYINTLCLFLQTDYFPPSNYALELNGSGQAALGGNFQTLRKSAPSSVVAWLTEIMQLLAKSLKCWTKQSKTNKQQQKKKKKTEQCGPIEEGRIPPKWEGLKNSGPPWTIPYMHVVFSLAVFALRAKYRTKTLICCLMNAEARDSDAPQVVVKLWLRFIRTMCPEDSPD